MIGYKKLCLDDTDTGDYIDKNGKKYHYRRFSKRKGMRMVQGWADLKFEYIWSFLGMGVILLVGSLGLIGDEMNEAVGCYVGAFYMGMSVLCACVAANTRPKKSLAYLLPISAKDYFRRNVISYLTSVLGMMVMLGVVTTVMRQVIGEDAWGDLLSLLTFSGEERMMANFFVFDMCLIQIISMIPLLFMEGKERVKKYVRIMITVFFSIMILFAGIFYMPSDSSTFLSVIIFYGTLLLLLWIKKWSKALWGGVLGGIIAVLFLFEDEAWLDWLFSEDWSIYTMIARGGGWRNVFIILLLVCALASIPFFLRLAYREAQPYYYMKKAFDEEGKN